jgi:hypothetical protein
MLVLPPIHAVGCGLRSFLPRRLLHRPPGESTDLGRSQVLPAALTPRRKPFRVNVLVRVGRFLSIRGNPSSGRQSLVGRIHGGNGPPR